MGLSFNQSQIKIINVMKQILNVFPLFILSILIQLPFHAMGQTENKQEISNPYFLICECKNSNNLSLDEYVSSQNKSETKSPIEKIESQKLLTDKTSWLHTEFLSNSTYMDNLKNVGIEMQKMVEKNPERFNNMDSKNAEELLKQIKTEYPVCWEMFPVFVSLVNG